MFELYSKIVCRFSDIFHLENSLECSNSLNCDVLSTDNVDIIYVNLYDDKFHAVPFDKQAGGDIIVCEA